ncbi:MAG: neutral zinc metallopeptidase [Sulfuricaulis sp.]|uniref:KPN_02809 family neutral zinc metallopeptidase n=1 Tax=Sulfuricaulis sp. TaxID=2003553 RepID=UPI003C6B486A
MLWKGERQSENVEDRRGFTLARGIGGGGLGILAVALVAMFFGVDPTVILQDLTTSNVPTSSSSVPVALTAAEQEQREFVSVVLADTEDAWHELFRQMSATYSEPKLVLFTGAVESACGMAQSAVGPFYCAQDQKIYIDLDFYRELRDRFHAPGDFAQAYVIAHEVGHHVQNLLGVMPKVQEARLRADARGGNALSVRLELQADCFAGVWANHANKMKHMLEAGDVEEGLNAATAIGDDRLQRQAGRSVSPDSFTHGSSVQRVSWFKRGLANGDLRDCDTFAAAQL